ncbi:MAG TPA: dTDP-4-dehydrorhamnose reductase [Anaerolineaceae bacterium]
MRILILGKTGQLGWELLRATESLGPVIALDYPEIDLSHPEMIRELIGHERPQVIINATAYTDVDGAERDAKLAMAINGYGPGFLAEEARRIKAALIHYSTDYVFDGKLGSAYTEADTPNPLGSYAQSKLAGEQWVQGVSDSYLIFRTAWLYSMRRPSFVTKVLGWARKQETLKVVTDQVSNPTWARMMAEVTAQVLAMSIPDPAGWIAEHRGLYHVAGSGHASRFEWAQAILACDPRKEEQTVRELQPALTADFPTPAERPLFSALDCSLFESTFGLYLPEWRQTLSRAME